ncbi:transmembrane 9 superfamily member 12-like protein [Tanacetum coccineum]
MNEELSGWKLVVGDVFREPTNSKLLCVMIETDHRLQEWQVLLLYLPPLDSCYQLHEMWLCAFLAGMWIQFSWVLLDWDVHCNVNLVLLRTYA